MDRPRLKRKDDRNEPSLAEKAFMAASVVVTLALFGYLAYEAATAPALAEPRAEIERVEPQPDGGYQVTVRLENPGGKGLRLATVEVACGAPPPEVTVDNIPAESHRTVVLMCPQGEAPTKAEVSAWFEA